MFWSWAFLLHLVVNFVFFILVQFTTTVHHCLSRVLFQCQVAYPQLMSNIWEAQAKAADPYSPFWITKHLLCEAKKYTDLSCPQLAAGGK